MTSHHDHSHTIVATAATLTLRSGPLDGLEGILWLRPDTDLTDLRLSLPRGDGYRDLYHHDGVPGPGGEVLLRYIGQQLG